MGNFRAAYRELVGELGRHLATMLACKKPAPVPFSADASLRLVTGTLDR